MRIVYVRVVQVTPRVVQDNISIPLDVDAKVRYIIKFKHALPNAHLV